MKIKSIIFPLIAILFLTSCVSTKKYEEARAELAKYKVNDTYQGVALATEKYESSGIQLERGQEILAMDAKMDSLVMVIKELRRKVDACEKSK